MMDTVDIVTLIISGMALAISIFQFFIEKNRQKKEATLIAYNNLQKEVFSELKKYDLKTIKKGDGGWDTVTRCLAIIENFSVGLNTGIYSLDILNRLGGGFFIEQYEELSFIISKKREENKNSKHYDEFEKVVNELRRKRGGVL